MPTHSVQGIERDRALNWFITSGLKYKAYWTTNSIQLSSYIIKGTHMHTQMAKAGWMYILQMYLDYRILWHHKMATLQVYVYKLLKRCLQICLRFGAIKPLKATILYSKLAHDYKVYLPPASSIQGCVHYNEVNHSTQGTAYCRCSKIKYKKFASADYKLFTIIHRVSLMWHSLLCCGSLEASWRAWACSTGEMSLRQCVRTVCPLMRFSLHIIAYTLTKTLAKIAV